MLLLITWSVGGEVVNMNQTVTPNKLEMGSS